jgi:hypothetical protein
VSEQPILSPRAALRFILIRYDTDAGLAPGAWAIVKALQTDLSWLRHRRACARDAARVHLNQQIERPLISRGVKST